MEDQIESTIESNVPLVHHFTKRYRRFLNRDEYEDLVQEGMIGLWKASLKYDPDYGTKFSSFAGACILNHIHRYFRSKYAKKHDSRKTQSLDQPISISSNGTVFTLLDRMRDASYDIEASVEAREMLSRINQLPARQRNVLHQIALGYTQQEIGMREGVSQVTVSRRKTQALKKLKGMSK